jgi:hypothetical protein
MPPHHHPSQYQIRPPGPSHPYLYSGPLSPLDLPLTGNGPPSPSMTTTPRLSLLLIRKKSPLLLRLTSSTASTSGGPSQPHNWRQWAKKSLPFHHPPRALSRTTPSSAPSRGSTPLPPTATVIDLTSPSPPPLPARSPSYHVRTPTPATPHPPAHMRQLHWTPPTPDLHGAMLPNPLNTPFILAQSPTPPPRRARLLQMVALVDSDGNMQAFGMVFVPPNTRLLHTARGITLSSFPPL